MRTSGVSPGTHRSNLRRCALSGIRRWVPSSRLPSSDGTPERAWAGAHRRRQSHQGHEAVWDSQQPDAGAGGGVSHDKLMHGGTRRWEGCAICECLEGASAHEGGVAIG